MDNAVLRNLQWSVLISGFLKPQYSNGVPAAQGQGGNMKKTKSEIDKYIGARIREHWLAQRLIQEQLANALGVTFQHVQKL
jgi:hypothetical protein